LPPRGLYLSSIATFQYQFQNNGQTQFQTSNSIPKIIVIVIENTVIASTYFFLLIIFEVIAISSSTSLKS
jgi:hypothetical protein